MKVNLKHDFSIQSASAESRDRARHSRRASVTMGVHLDTVLKSWAGETPALLCWRLRRQRRTVRPACPGKGEIPILNWKLRTVSRRALAMVVRCTVVRAAVFLGLAASAFAALPHLDDALTGGAARGFGRRTMCRTPLPPPARPSLRRMCRSTARCRKSCRCGRDGCGCCREKKSLANEHWKKTS